MSELLSERSTGAVGSAKRAPRVGVTLVTLMLAAFVAILNETVLSVALPQLMVDFSIDASVAQWLTTGFLLTMAIVIPTTGFLMGRFTRRTLFIAALTAFILGTALAAVAGSFAIMMFARVIQAVGTAIILPLLMSTTMLLVAPARRGVMMGLSAVVISVGPAIGPTLAGLVMNSLSWHWVFIFMLPIAVLVLVIGAIVLRLPQQRSEAMLDVLSVVLAALGFGGLVYAFASASAVLRGDLIPIAIGVVGIIGMALFVLRQRHTQDAGALLDLRPFAVPMFRRATILVAMAFATMLGTVIVLPLYFQDGLGLTVLQTGLLLLGGGLTQAIAAPLFGRLYDTIGARPIVIPGAILLLVGQLALATVDGTTHVALVVVFYVIFSAGVAAILATMMTSALGAVDPRLIGHGTAIINTVQQLGGAIGSAGMIAALTIGAHGASGAGAVLAGTRVAFILGAIFAAIAVVAAFTVRKVPAHQQ